MSDASQPVASPARVVVMGVAGCGKSVVGEQLAESLGVPLIDGDDFHPPGDIAKMRAGAPLTEADRTAWIQRLAEELRSQPDGAVLSCPALKRAHRDVLRRAVPHLHFIHLRLSQHQALERLAARTDHFYPPSLVGADFDALEDPAAEPLVHACDATRHVDRTVEDALQWLATAGVAFNNA